MVNHWRWTDEEVAFLAEAASLYTVQELAVMLGRTPPAIYQACNKNGIKPKDRRRVNVVSDLVNVVQVRQPTLLNRSWTEEDDNELRSLSCNKTLAELSPLINRTIKATRLRCHHLGITFIDARSTDEAKARIRSQRATVERTETSQRCTSCNEFKLYELFPVDKTSPVGRASKCNSCRSEYIKQLRAKNPDKFKESSRIRMQEWRVKNRPLDYAPPRQWRKDENGQECKECGYYKPWLDFYSNVSYSSGIDVRCKECVKWEGVLRRHGISREQFKRLYEQQNGVCFLCSFPETKKHHSSGTLMDLSVDHDHMCCGSKKSCMKCIRGLLCHSCNYIIGVVETKPMLTERFSDYLSRRPLLDVPEK